MKGIKGLIVKSTIAAVLFAIFCLGVPGISLETVWADEIASDTTYWSGKMALTSENVTINSGISLSGDTTLNIAGGMTLTVNNGINCNGHLLTIEGSGAVKVTGKQDGGHGGIGITGKVAMKNGILKVYGGHGGNSDTAPTGDGGIGIRGDVTMENGTLTVAGGGGATYDGGIGIQGSVTISGGTLTATGGGGGNCGLHGIEGDVIQYGGILMATGGSCYNKGGDGICGRVTLNNGTLEAAGGEATSTDQGLAGGGDGIRGDVSLVSGTLMATGGASQKSGSAYGAGVKIADGKAFTDGTKVYRGTLSNDDKTAIAGQSLTSCPAAIGEDFYATVQEAINAANFGQTVKLFADVTTSTTITVTGTGTKTLDLNGYGIRYTGNNESVIKIINGGNLTLEDSNSTRKHYITLTNGRGTAVSDTMSDGAIEVTGGYITGGYIIGGSSETGAGININSSTLTMKAGTIIGNIITADANGNGGGGGGVYVANGSTFVMEGGSIFKNATNGYNGKVLCEGGGVRSDGTFTMKGGSITCNEACLGGGVCSYGNFTMEGGTISNNLAKEEGGKVGFGGGVYVARTFNSEGEYVAGTFKMSKGAVIENNNAKRDGKEGLEDLYLASGKLLTIDGALGNSAEIHITMENPGVFTNSTDPANNDPTKFVSYNTSYDIRRNTDGQLELAATTTCVVTFKVANGKWSDGTSTEQTIKLTKFADDTNPLKLSENQIPAAGQKPNSGYKEGSWDKVPDTTTEITGDVTYTYTYNKVPAPAPGPVNPTPAPTQEPAPTPAPTQTPTPEPTTAPTPNPTPDPTPAPTTAPTPEPLPTPAPDPAENVNPSADPTEGKAPQGEAKVTEENGVKTTEQENTDGSKTVIVEDSNTNTVTKTVEETDGSKTTQTVTEENGTKTETGRTEDKDGNFVEKTITTGQDGKQTEETKSKVTNEDKSVTTTEGTKAADGTSTYLEKTEQTNGDYEQTFVVQDEAGKTIGSEVSSKATDPETNAITEKKETRDAEGNKEETVISKESSGSVTAASVKETDSSGKSTESAFEPSKDNKLTLSDIKTDGSSVVIPSAVVGLDGETYPVTKIGKDVLKGQKVDEITIPETVNKLNPQAFKDCGITEIHISGSVEKGMLGKNALKGNGSGENCKGLTIIVDSKKDAKALKKQLKKAGAKGAKVVVKK